MNRSYFDHVVHVEGRRVGFATGLMTTNMRMCYDRTTAGLVLTVHQMGGRRYDVRSEASWMPGEPVRLVIGGTPNHTRLGPRR